MKYVDLNCDLGESYFDKKVGDDASVIPFISSCNIACGLHGGDPLTIQTAIELAIENNVNIGAHPSFPDLENFGRTNMHLSKTELLACLRFQIGMMQNFARNRGGVLKHVKPHGALYNMAAKDIELATAIAEIIAEFGADLALLGMSNSMMELAAKNNNLKFVAETFADRNYTADGALVARSESNAVITKSEQLTAHCNFMLANNAVKTIDGGLVAVNPESICVHGDTPAALNHIKALRQSFLDNNIQVKPF